MIFLFGRNACESLLTEGGEGYRRIDNQFCFSLRDTERQFEDERYLILIDSTIDRSCEPAVESDIRQVIDCYEANTDPGGLFAGTYFIALYDKQTERLSLWRDISGIMTGYYAISGGRVIGGNELHAIAKNAGVSEFDQRALFELLYTMYFVDGRTFYQGVCEVRTGGRLCFDLNGGIVSDRVEPIRLADEENGRSETENIALLREGLTETIQKHAGKNNVVLLSGGIDSVVLLLALDELRPDATVRAVSYLAAGTSEDETVYAQDIADHLKTKLEIREVNPHDPGLYQRFEETVLSMNNPYYGVWIFGQLPNATPHTRFFAGQDTRLHTPDMNVLDRWLFRFYFARRNPIWNVLLAGLSFICRPLEWFNLSHASFRVLKGIGRLPETLNTARYLRRYVFKCDSRVFRREGLPLDQYEAIRKEFTLDLSGVNTSRQLYNRITLARWRHQFISNLRFLIDLGHLNNSYLTIPYYDAELARLLSALPFDQVTMRMTGQGKYSGKKTRVSKYMLRMAFKERLTETAFRRQKAVSMSLALLLEGEIGRKVRELLVSDLQSEASFLRSYELERFVAPFVEETGWQRRSYRFQYCIYYLACYVVYYRRILNRSSSKTESARTVTDQINS